MSKDSKTLADYRQDVSISRGPLDVPFLMLVLILLTVGIVMVLSASYASAYYDLFNETGGTATYYFRRQLIFAVGGVAVMLVASRFPVSFFRRFAFPVLGISILLLLAVLVLGVGTEQAVRWIKVGPITIQPSEIAKIGIILVFAHMICLYKNEMGTFKRGVLPFVIVLGLVVGPLALQPHLSASLIIIAIGAIMMFVGGTRKLWFIGGIAVVAALMVLAFSVLDFASSRLIAWRDPFNPEMIRNDSFQIVQSLYAIGSGGLFGLGLGQSRQKYLYLPEEHNDYIFAIVCEELGFIGAALILVLFALLIIRGYYIALHCRDRYSFLVCIGITSMFALQIILNVAVCTNLLPATGISLPFFSYGRNALLIQLAEMGIVLSISRDVPTRKTFKRKNPVVLSKGDNK